MVDRTINLDAERIITHLGGKLVQGGKGSQSGTSTGCLIYYIQAIDTITYVPMYTTL